MWPNPAMNNSAAALVPQALVDYDFVNGVYKQSGVSAALASQTGWTFTRTTTGYASTVAGVWSSFAIDAPRITNKGLLIEAAATNSILQSTALTNASWTKDQGGTGVAPVVTAGQADPAGGTGAFKLDFVKGTSFSRLTQSVGFAPDATWSCFLKADAAGPNIAEYLSSTPGTTLSLTTSWQRYSLSGPAAAGSQVCSLLLFTAIAGSPATATCYAWLPQLEPQTTVSPSSPIPTTTLPVARGADVASQTFTGARTVTVTYGGGLTATVVATSPLNLGSSSGGAWVGSYVERVVVW